MINPSEQNSSLTSQLALKIVDTFHEFNAATLIKDISAFLGAERTETYFNDALSIQESGGMMTKRGDRKRTPGGIFFSIVKDNLNDLERELLFPYGRHSFPDSYLVASLNSLTLDQLEIGARRIEETMRGERLTLPQDRRLQLLRMREILLKRIAELKGKETQASLKAVMQTVSELPDDETRTLLMQKVEEIEKKAAEKTEIVRESVEVEQARQKMQIQLEAEERRAKTRLRYLERLLERESVATMLGSILLAIISLALIVGMFVGKIETKIIENGFLVLLGYFFGQTTGRSLKQGSQEEK
jgi:hypothetical protein